MRNFILCLTLLFFSNTASFAQSYCPTPGEYQDTLQDYQSKAMKLLTSGSDGLSKTEELYNDQDKYIKSILPSCIEYFNNPNTNYDCKKLQTLSASYIILDRDEQPSVKLKINKFPSKVQQQCSFEYDAMRRMIDDINR